MYAGVAGKREEVKVVGRGGSDGGSVWVASTGHRSPVAGRGRGRRRRGAGSGTRERQNRGPFFRKKDHLTTISGVFIEGKCNVFGPF